MIVFLNVEASMDQPSSLRRETKLSLIYIFLDEIWAVIYTIVFIGIFFSYSTVTKILQYTPSQIALCAFMVASKIAYPSKYDKITNTSNFLRMDSKVSMLKYKITCRCLYI